MVVEIGDFRFTFFVIDGGIEVTAECLEVDIDIAESMGDAVGEVLTYTFHRAPAEDE